LLHYKSCLPLYRKKLRKDSLANANPLKWNLWECNRDKKQAESSRGVTQ